MVGINVYFGVGDRYSAQVIGLTQIIFYKEERL
jgi:hypothetical protein